VFAVGLLLPRRFQLVFLTVVLGGLAALGYALNPQGPIGQAYTSPLLVEFLAGVWLCEAWRRQWLKSQRGWVLVLVGLGWFTIVETAGFYHGAQRPLTWGVPALLVVAGFVAMETAGRKIRLTVFEALGDCSYSIYLFHGIVLAVLVSMPKTPLIFLIGVPLSLIIGGLAFRFAETPMLRFMSPKQRRRLASAT
jgi:exopolysaccharide production protein ExoZ